MDAKDFDGYLALCDPAFHYAITAFSPEIRKSMTWLEHDHAGMVTLFGNLPKHNSDHSLLSRHATVYTIEELNGGETAKVTSALQVFRTTLDGGATELFAVGKMTDTVRLSAVGARLLDRNIHLETRMIGFGFHIPF
ncbi:methanesulfonate monooxygenase small subunit [Glaciimonas immobilis]|uniref:Methanesulfonate monooxygenase small subunit n=2 Tax=Glaciimonas immobilis TaxID=728004 RepID=A0A840RVC1_9BURK|nr:methanesulfonate monooxygenase small subunit [Glaciimonas immobilis]